MHPQIAALALHHPKEFHIGGMKLAHMSGHDGSVVIFVGLCLVVAFLMWNFVLKSSN